MRGLGLMALCVFAGCFETRRFFITETGGPDCGDAKVQGKEACDTALARGHDACLTRDADRFVGGTLACVACAIDERACIAPTDSHLLIYLPLDGGSLGDRAATATSPLPALNGVTTTNGAVTTGEGRVGAGASFSTTAAGFAWSGSTKVNVAVTALQTVSFWVRLDADTADGALIYSDGARRLRTLKSADDYLLMLEIDDGPHQRIITSNRFVHPAAWTYVALGINASGSEVRLVLLPTDGPIDNQAVAVTSLSSGAMPRVGFGATTTLPSFIGDLDELKIWTDLHDEPALCSEAGGTSLASAHHCVFE